MRTRQLASQDGLLQVSSRHQTDRHAGSRSAYVEVLYQLFCSGGDLSGAKHSVAAIRRILIALEDEVLFERHTAGKACTEPIFRDIGQT